MNGKNIYSGNINSTPGFVQRPTNNNIGNKKYIATIVSENLQKESIEKPNFDEDRARLERKKAKARQNAEIKKQSKEDQPDQLLEMAVDYSQYDFNEWNRKIVDAYNPYAIDDTANSTLTNYQKIKRIIKNEEAYEENFNKFSENLEDIYDDIKEKITNETLKTIYGEDNFEYIPNELGEYQENWTTGDEQADLLLKLYHSPKIKQRDISAQDYIAQRFNAFAQTVDGKQSFEVEAAKTGVNPTDVVRVHLDKAYYMDEGSLESNRDIQQGYTKRIMEEGGSSMKKGFGTKPGLNRFGANRPSPKPAAPRPAAPAAPVAAAAAQGPVDPNANTFVPMSEETENAEASVSSMGTRAVPRRDEWVSQSETRQSQLAQLSDAEKKWAMMESLKNEKLEDFIIENGFIIDTISNDPETNEITLKLETIVYPDADREAAKLKAVEKFVKRNKCKFELITPEGTNKQIFVLNFINQAAIAAANLESMSENLGEDVAAEVAAQDELEAIASPEEIAAIQVEGDISELDVSQKPKQPTSLISDEKNELPKPFGSTLTKTTIIDKPSYNMSNKMMGLKNQAPTLDNIEGIAGMRRVGSPVLNEQHSVHPNAKKIRTKRDVEVGGGVTSTIQPKMKSLAEVLAEKRNKNHKQMNEARISNANKTVGLQKALDDVNKDAPDHGPKKKRLYE